MGVDMVLGVILILLKYFQCFLEVEWGEVHYLIKHGQVELEVFFLMMIILMQEVNSKDGENFVIK